VASVRNLWAELMRRPEAMAMVLLMWTIAIWGSTPQVTDVAAGYARPLTLTSLRAAPTAAVLLLALPLLRFRLPRGVSEWLFTAVGGFLMVGVFLGGFTEGISRAGPGNAIVLSSTSPFWVAILSRVVYGERISRRTATGLLVGFGGVILVFSSQLGSHTGTGQTVVGLAWSLAAALGWALGTLVVKAQLNRRPDSDLLGIVTGQYLVGGIGLLAVSFAVEGTGAARWGAPDLWLAVAYIAIVGSAIATVAYFGALRVLSPTRVTSWAFLSPVVAVLIGLGLGTVPEPAVFAGMAITVAGVFIVNLPGRRRSTTATIAAPVEPAILEAEPATSAP
jgi:drug/metabolite transporter (DMT)-like permease